MPQKQPQKEWKDGMPQLLSMLGPVPHNTSSSHGLTSDSSSISCQWGSLLQTYFPPSQCPSCKVAQYFHILGARHCINFWWASWGFSLWGLHSNNISFQGNPVLQHTGCSSHFGAICQFVEGVLYSIIPVINRGQCWTVLTPASVPGKRY